MSETQQAGSSMARTDVLDDRLLMRRIAAGDRAAFHDLYERYVDLVYSMALKVVQDPAAAEDIVQDVFLRIWQRANQFDASRGRLATWLLSITRNRAIDVLRQQNRQRIAADAFDERRDDHALAAHWYAERDETVHLSLEILPPEQRRCIELAFFYGLTHQDIAAMLGLPLGTVKSRIRLGMRKLQAALREEQSKGPT